ncbi:MAG: biopolymer transporter ExbD [Fibrobacteres bacterium]|nr:biopolymer transporter ExbD [Fibrobacterota bacterium]
MSFISGIKAQQPSVTEEEIELNLTPIMNMFLVLVPFLVSMAVFAHMAIIEVNLPQDAAGQTKGPKSKDLKLTVVVASDGYSIVLGDSIYTSLPLVNGKHAADSLRKNLEQIRPVLNNKDQLIVAVNDGISFEKIVDAMDAGRGSGFTKLSLSGGAPIEDKKK